MTDIQKENKSGGKVSKFGLNNISVQELFLLNQMELFLHKLMR